MRYRLAFFPTLLILLLVGSFFLPTRFLPAAQAHGLFDPLEVGGVAPLVKLSRVTGHKSSSRTLRMSIGLALRHQDQLTALRALGCTQAQGYLIGQPAPLDLGRGARSLRARRSTA